MCKYDVCSHCKRYVMVLEGGDRLEFPLYIYIISERYKWKKDPGPWSKQIIYISEYICLIPLVTLLI
jgi:hypothetical protein